MPIYEFYCKDCNTIFNFFSQRINTEKRPQCPRCKKGHIDRIISRFSVQRGAKLERGLGLPNIDEAKIGKALSIMEKEAQGMNEDDPQQTARVMRKIFDASGIDLGSGIRESINRMEAGENPDRIDEDLGNLLNGKDFLKKTSRLYLDFRIKNPALMRNFITCSSL